MPFFLYYAPTAPHDPAIPDPRDVSRFDLQGYAQPPSYGRAEAGAPNFIRDLPWSSDKAERIASFHRHQLNSAYGVDRSIGQLWTALPDNTLVLFMSDNGYSWGEHRWASKMLPYNEDLRIPMMIVGKNLNHPLTAGIDPCPSLYAFTTSCDARIVLNVDVLPTLEAAAGVTTEHLVEGLDMLGSATRSDFVLEHWNNGDAPTYCGVRSAGWMYVRYNRFEEPVKEELYDESTDSFEMNNLAVTATNDPSVLAELQAMRDRAATLCSVDGGIYPNDWPYQ
jgi:N-acetylglucosamine-6-sulfatase